LLPFILHSDKTVSLNSIILEDYALKKGIPRSEIITYDDPYKSWERDTTKKLKKMFPVLEEYKNKDNRYNIPEIVADILRIILSQDSGKGSFVSKLKNSDYDKITYEEIKSQINTILDILIAKHKDYRQYLEGVKKEWLEGIIYVCQIEESKRMLKNSFNDNLDLYIDYLFGMESFADISLIIACSEHPYRLIIDDPDAPPDSQNPIYTMIGEVFGRQERLELLNILKSYIHNSFELWKRLCINYHRITDETDTEDDRNLKTKEQIMHDIMNTKQSLEISELYKLTIKYEEELRTEKFFDEEIKESLKRLGF